MVRKRAANYRQMNNSNGFTIVEVMVAMAIFFIGFLAAAQMQMKSVSGNAAARMQTEATTVAVDRLERLNYLPYGHADLDELSNPHEATEGGYSIVWNVTDDVPINSTKTIDITVTSANPFAKPVTLQFIKAADSDS